MPIEFKRLNGNPKLVITAEQQVKARQAVKDLRDYYRMTHHEVATHLNCSSSIVGGWFENGRSVGSTYYPKLIDLHEKMSTLPVPVVCLNPQSHYRNSWLDVNR
jgi:DNA-binding transcriptional regulator YiaG